MSEAISGVYQRAANDRPNHDALAKADTARMKAELRIIRNRTSK
jgi:hypothetical protein